MELARASPWARSVQQECFHVFANLEGKHSLPAFLVRHRELSEDVTTKARAIAPPHKVRGCRLLTSVDSQNHITKFPGFWQFCLPCPNSVEEQDFQLGKSPLIRGKDPPAGKTALASSIMKDARPTANAARIHILDLTPCAFSTTGYMMYCRCRIVLPPCDFTIAF